MLHELTRDFADEVRISGRRIAVAIEDSLPTVRADREALGRAVWNLLDNASKYSPTASTITVETGLYA